MSKNFQNLKQDEFKAFHTLVYKFKGFEVLNFHFKIQGYLRAFKFCMHSVGCMGSYGLGFGYSPFGATSMQTNKKTTQIAINPLKRFLLSSM